ncbi:MAG TPA: hypothetical protein V6D15_08430 [Oculatellaceae cyanobacterium]|jgi:hypothetical protein
MFRTITNAVLAIGYGVYLTANCSKEQKQAIKAELEAKRQQQQALQPQPEVTTPAPQIEVEPEVVEIAETVVVPTVDDVWEAPLQATKKQRWTTVGQIHTITPQLLLLPALEVAEQPTIDYSSWTVKALKDLAQKRNIKAYYKLRKSELIEVLTA